MAKWSEEAIQALKSLYVKTDIPSDTLIKDKDALSKFTREVNSKITEKIKFSTKEVASEILRIRKTGNLPRIRS